MSRIAAKFSALKVSGRTALIPYVTAGDPNIETTLDLMSAAVAAGADLLELGVPFSDPMAEGPVIQLACERALLAGTKVQHIFDMVSRFRQQDDETPVILMGYLNPLEAIGYDAFTRAAAEAGVDGLLIVDMPIEEADDLRECCSKQGLDLIFLIAPTSSAERTARICAVASGFVYYVSLKGVTGAGNLDTSLVIKQVALIREHTKLPIAVGFGISDGAAAAKIAATADGVVIGSAVVQRIAEHQNNKSELLREVGEFLRAIRQAID